jgi:adenylate kinase
MRIVLLGAPGAGKDTLADKFKSQYNYTILSPGEIYRKQAQDGTELGVKARDEYWGKGYLCPDSLTNELVKNTIENLNEKELFNTIFNGYPRSFDQAEFLSKIINVPMVIDLIVSEDIAVDRLLKRGRIDDTEEIIRRRFQEYEKKTKSVSNFYKNHGMSMYASIDADDIPQAIFEEAFGIIIENMPYCDLDL